ncbi:MAG: light-harvesting protein [Rhodobacteraceae bacterium]|jgi:light-harvesting protein B-800-850 alpha chain|nr:light-harvesting protein [Paracoccaceae bacterium]
MNNAKMWLVVKPTVGVPLFLSAVAIGSFAVHVAVLSNTTWVSDFLKGKPIAGGTAALEMPAEVAPAQAAFVTPGAQEVLVLMPDGTTARAILQPQDSLAALE